jgi:tetratricopeptide (TPR) repeat protein
MAETKIFISYARRDSKTLANRLHNDLATAGYDVWLDISNIPGGTSWTTEIERAIDNCEVALALLSAGSYVSEICRAEQLYALRKGKRVIPVLVQPSAGLPLHLGHLNYRDFTNAAQYDEQFQILIGDIGGGTYVPLPATYQRTSVSTNAPPRPPHFLERPEVLNHLRAAVTSDETDRRIGITAIQGMGGIGKTVMAAALCRDDVVQNAYPDGIVWITVGQTPGSLLTRLRYLLESLGETVGSNDDQETMVGKLRTVLPQKAALIVLDDVWDVEAMQPFIVEGAPAARLLFTTRDASLVTALGADEFPVNVLSAKQSRQLLSEWTGMAPPDLPVEADEVAHHCGNLPLALALCGALVRDGDSWVTVRDALRDADLPYFDQPHGSVMKSIKISIDALERENPAYARHYRELGVFPDDVAIPEETVVTLWLYTNGLDERRARRLIHLLGHKALIQVSGTQPHRTIELHDIQHLYLHQALTNLGAAHQELLAAYGAKCPSGWASGPNDGYFFEHLAYHLRKAGGHAELYNLLTASPDWMNAKFAACIGDTSYAADLDQTIVDFADPLDADQVLVLARLHTARQIVHTRVSIYTDTDLKTLVWLGREQEALSHARLRSEPREQFNGLLAIYLAQKQQQRADMTLLDALPPLAYTITEEWSRAVALCALAAALAQAGDGRATMVFDEAGAVARGIPDEGRRAAVLNDLAAALAQAGDGRATMVFDEAGAVARGIPEAGRRAATLSGLAVALTQAGKFDEAGAVVRGIPEGARRAATLCALAAALAQVGDGRAAVLFDEAGTMVHGIQEEWSRAAALSNLAAALAQVGDGRTAVVFDEAGEAARGIQEEWSRAVALRDLAAALTQAGQFDKAGAVSRGIQDEGSRAAALSNLAAALAQAGDGRAAMVFDEAGAVARSVQDEWRQAEALSDLVVALAQARQFDAAGAVARGIQDKTRRAAALSDLAIALAQARQFDEAGAVARGIQDEGSRAAALCALAAALAQAGQFDEAAAVARVIDDKGSLAAALRALAAALAQAGQVDEAAAVFDEAGAAARNISEQAKQVEALRGLVVALAQAGKFDEAGAVARGIQEEWGRAEALSDLAATLAQAGDGRAAGVFDEASAVARGIQDGWRRAAALRDLAAALIQAGDGRAAGVLDEVDAAAHSIRDEGFRAEALRALAAALVQVGDRRATGVFDEVGAAARGIPEGWRRAAALRALAAALAQAGDGRAAGVFDEAGLAARSIPEGGRRAATLRALAAALAQAGRFGAAFATLGKRDPVEFVQEMAKWAKSFDALQHGLSVLILHDILRIITWERPAWQNTYDLLTAGEKEE